MVYPICNRNYVIYKSQVAPIENFQTLRQHCKSQFVTSPLTSIPCSQFAWTHHLVEYKSIHLSICFIFKTPPSRQFKIVFNIPICIKWYLYSWCPCSRNCAQIFHYNIIVFGKWDLGASLVSQYVSILLGFSLSFAPLLYDQNDYC